MMELGDFAKNQVVKEKRDLITKIQKSVSRVGGARTRVCEKVTRFEDNRASGKPREKGNTRGGC